MKDFDITEATPGTLPADAAVAIDGAMTSGASRAWLLHDAAAGGLPPLMPASLGGRVAAAVRVARTEAELEALAAGGRAEPVDLPAEPEARAKLLADWAKKTLAKNRKGLVPMLLLPLAACGGGGDDGPAALQFTIDDNASGTTLPITGAAGGAVITVESNDPAQETVNNLTIDADGSGTIRISFEDEDDIVVLSATTDFSGFSVIEVQAGTVDFSAVPLANLGGATIVYINSAAIFTHAQFMALTSVQSSSGHGVVHVDVADIAEAMAVGAAKGKITGAKLEIDIDPASSATTALTVEQALAIGHHVVNGGYTLAATNDPVDVADLVTLLGRIDYALDATLLSNLTGTVADWADLVAAVAEGGEIALSATFAAEVADPVGVSAVNDIAALTTGTVTAEITNTSLTVAGADGQTLQGLADEVNAYIITITDTHINAGQLQVLDDKTSEEIDATACTHLTGAADDIREALVEDRNGDRININGSSTIAVTITEEPSTTRATDLIAIDLETAAWVDATRVTDIIGTVADLITALGAQGLNLNTNVALTATDQVLSAHDLRQLDLMTTGTITVGPATTPSTDYTLKGTLDDIAAVMASGGTTVAATVAIDVSEVITVAQANELNADAETGTITATIIDTDMATLGTLAGTGNAYTITVTDAVVDAGDLALLYGKTIEAVNAAPVQVLTGTVGEIQAVREAADTVVTGLGNEELRIDGGALTAAQFVTLAPLTTGAIDATVTGLVGDDESDSDQVTQITTVIDQIGKVTAIDAPELDLSEALYDQDQVDGPPAAPLTADQIGLILAKSTDARITGSDDGAQMAAVAAHIDHVATITGSFTLDVHDATDHLDAVALAAILSKVVPAATVTVDAAGATLAEIQAIVYAGDAVDTIIGLTLTAAIPPHLFGPLLGKVADGTASVIATGMDTGALATIAQNQAKIADDGITGDLTLESAGLTGGQIGALLDKAAATATVTVNAAGMDTDKLTAVATNIGKVDTLTNLALTSAQTDAQIGQLLGSAAVANGSVTVDATGMDAARLIAVAGDAADIAKIADNGITGSLALATDELTGAQIGLLLGKTADHAAVTVNAAGGADSDELLALSNAIAKVDAITNLSLTNGNVPAGLVAGTAVITNVLSKATGATVDASFLSTAKLAAVAGGIDGVGSITGTVSIVAAELDAGDIGALLGAAATDATATVTVNAQGASLDDLIAVAQNIAAVDDIDDLIVIAGLSAEAIAALLGKAADNDAQVNATDMGAGALAVIADQAGDVAANGITGTLALESAGLTGGQIGALLGKAAATANVTVNAAGMDTAELAQVATHIDKVAVNGLTNLALTSEQTDAQIGQLLGSAAVANASVTVDATGMDATQLAAVATGIAKIADNGITGSLALATDELTGAQIIELLTHTAPHATVTVDGSGVAGSDDISALSGQISKVDSIINLTLTNGNVPAEDATAATVITNVLSKATGATVDASSMNTAKLAAVAGGIDGVGSITGTVSIVAAELDAGDIGALLGAAADAATVTVDADGASLDALIAVAQNIAAVDTINSLTVTAGLPAEWITALLDKAPTDTAAADATGMNTAQLLALAANADHLEAGGITGDVTIDAAAFADNGGDLTALLGKIDASATVTVDAAGANTVQLQALAGGIAAIDSIENLTVDNALDAGQIDALLGKATGALVGGENLDATELGHVATHIDRVAPDGITALTLDDNVAHGDISDILGSRTADGSVSVTATGMDAAKLNAIAAEIGEIGAITGTLALTLGVDAANITALLSKAGAANVTVTLAGMQPDQLAALASSIDVVDSLTDNPALDSADTAATIGAILNKYTGAAATVNASGMSAAQLDAVAVAVTKVATGQLTNLTLDASVSATTIGTLLADDGVANGSVTVNANGMSAAQLEEVAEDVGKVANDGLTNLTLDSTIDAADITALLDADAVGNATVSVVATGMDDAQLAAVAGGIGKIADDGITGAVDISETGTLTEALIDSLLDKVAAEASVAVNANGFSTDALEDVSDSIAKVDAITNLTVTANEEPAEIGNLLSKASAATVNAAGMDEPDLAAVAAQIGAVGSITGLTVTNAMGADLIGELVGTRTADNSVTANATGMGIAQLNAIAAEIAEFDEITGTLALTSALDATKIAALLDEYTGTTATADATGMDAAQLDALAAAQAKIAASGINGTMILPADSFDATEIGHLVDKLAGGASVEITGTASVAQANAALGLGKTVTIDAVEGTADDILVDTPLDTPDAGTETITLLTVTDAVTADEAGDLLDIGATTTRYSISDLATALAGAAANVRNGATDITATGAAINVADAQAIMNATNTGTTVIAAVEGDATEAADLDFTGDAANATITSLTVTGTANATQANAIHGLIGNGVGAATYAISGDATSVANLPMAVLNGATNITTTDAATAAEAAKLMQAGNSGDTTLHEVAGSVEALLALTPDGNDTITLLDASGTASVAQATALEAKATNLELETLSDSAAALEGADPNVLAAAEAIIMTGTATVAQANVVLGLGKTVTIDAVEGTAAEILTGPSLENPVANETITLITVTDAVSTGDATSLHGLIDANILDVTYSISGTALDISNLTAAVRNAATDITVTDTATLAQALAILDATNIGSTHIQTVDADTATPAQVKQLHDDLAKIGAIENLPLRVPTDGSADEGRVAQFDGLTNAEVQALLAKATGPVTIEGTPGADWLTLEGFQTFGVNLVITGGNGADVIYSGDGNDSITGGDGADYIEVGGGADTVDAGAGDDEIAVRSLDNADGSHYEGGDGTDTLTVYGTNDLTGSTWDSFESFVTLPGSPAKVTMTISQVLSFDTISGSEGNSEIIIVADKAKAVVADIRDGVSAGDAITFTYNGDAYIATLAAGTYASDAEKLAAVQAALDAAPGGGGTLGADKIIASFQGDNLVLTAAAVSDTLVSVSYTNDGGSEPSVTETGAITTIDFDAEGIVFDGLDRLTTSSDITDVKLSYAQFSQIGAVQNDRDESLAVGLDGETLDADLDLSAAELKPGTYINLTVNHPHVLTLHVDQVGAADIDGTGTLRIVGASGEVTNATFGLADDGSGDADLVADSVNVIIVVEDTGTAPHMTVAAPLAKVDGYHVAPDAELSITTAAVTGLPLTGSGAMVVDINTVTFNLSGIAPTIDARGEVTGNVTLNSGTNLGALEVTVTGHLTLDAEDAAGKTIDGAGQVTLRALQGAPDANLSTVTAATVHVELDLSGDVDVAANLSTADLLTISGTGAATIAEAAVLSAGLTIDVGANADLSMSAADLHTNTAVTGTGDVAVTGLEGAAAVQLSKVTASGTKTATVAGDVTFTGNLGTGFTTTVASEVTLTTTAAIATGQTIIGAGSVTITALQDTLDADLSGLTASTVWAAAVLAEGADLDFNGNLGSVNLQVYSTGNGGEVFDITGAAIGVTGNIAVGQNAVLIIDADQVGGRSIYGPDAVPDTIGGSVVITGLATGGGTEYSFVNVNAGAAGDGTAGTVEVRITDDTVLHANTNLHTARIDVAIGQTLTLTAAQADGRVITGEGNVVITDYDTFLDGVEALTLGGVADDLNVTLQLAMTTDRNPADDFTRVDTLEISGGHVATIGGVAVLHDALTIALTGATTLDLTAGQAASVGAITDDGHTTVFVRTLEAAPEADLGTLAGVTGSVTAYVNTDDQSPDVMLEAKLAHIDTLSVTGDGRLVIDTADADGDEDTVVATLNAGLTVTVAESATVQMTADAAAGIAGVEGAGTVEITDLAATPNADLSGVGVPVGPTTVMVVPDFFLYLSGFGLDMDRLSVTLATRGPDLVNFADGNATNALTNIESLFSGGVIDATRVGDDLRLALLDPAESFTSVQFTNAHPDDGIAETIDGVASNPTATVNVFLDLTSANTTNGELAIGANLSTADSLAITSTLADGETEGFTADLTGAVALNADLAITVDANSTLVITAGQADADAAGPIGGVTGTGTVTVTGLEDTPDADLTTLDAGLDVNVHLDMEGDVTDIGANLSTADSLTVTGGYTATIGASAVFNSDLDIIVEADAVLELTAAAADAAQLGTITGAGSVEVTELEGDTDANLSDIGTPATLTFAAVGTSLATGGTLAFHYNGEPVTITLGGNGGQADIEAALYAAIGPGAPTVAFGGTGGEDLILTAGRANADFEGGTPQYTASVEAIAVPGMAVAGTTVTALVTTPDNAALAFTGDLGQAAVVVDGTDTDGDDIFDITGATVGTATVHLNTEGTVLRGAVATLDGLIVTEATADTSHVWVVSEAAGSDFTLTGELDLTGIEVEVVPKQQDGTTDATGLVVNGTLTLRAEQAHLLPLTGLGDVVVTELDGSSDVLDGIATDLILALGVADATFTGTLNVAAGESLTVTAYDNEGAAQVLDLTGATFSMDDAANDQVTVTADAELKMTAAQATGASIYGEGAVHVSALLASDASDLGGIATHLTLDLEGDAVTFTGTLSIGTDKVLTLTGGDDGDVFDVRGATVGGDGSVVVAAGTMLRALAVQLHQAEISGGGAVQVAIAGGVLTQSVDLTDIGVPLSFVDVDPVPGALTSITIGSGATLTLTAAQADAFADAGGTIIGDGSLVITDATPGSVYDFTGFTPDAGVTVEFTGGELAPGTQLGNANIRALVELEPLILTAAQAGTDPLGGNARLISGPGDITITGSSGAQKLTIGGTGDRVIDPGAGDDVIELQTTGGTTTINITAGSGTVNTVTATGAGATYVVNLSVASTLVASTSSQAMVINGSTGNDVIATGSGADTVNLGSGGSDTYRFQSTRAENGEDVINGFTGGDGVDGDVLNLSAFLESGSGFHGVTVPSDAETNITGGVALLDDNGALDAAGLAAEFGSGETFTITASGKAVVITGDADPSSAEAKVWFVHDADNNGTIAAGEVTLVATITDTGGSTFDLDTLTSDNVVLV